MEARKIIKSAGTVGALTLTSRIFGMARDMSLAMFFGTSFAMSSFVLAFRVPNLFRSLFGEGALSSAFIPVFTQAIEKDGHTRAFVFANRMLCFIFLVLTLIALLGIIGVSVWIYSAPVESEALLTLRLLRIMLPYLVFICSAALLAAILNSLGHFTAPAAAQIILNVVIIAAAWAMFFIVGPEGDYKITVIAWSVVAAGVLQMLVQIPPLLKKGFRPHLANLTLRDPYLLKTGSLMSISAIGMGVTRVNVMIDGILAMIVGESAPSYLYFAERLVYLPIGVFATALGTVLLPAFSGYASLKNTEGMKTTANRSIRHLAFLMIPCSAAIATLAEPIVSLIYQRGDFTTVSMKMTALALVCYAPGLVFFGTLKIFIPVFYALQDMKTPVKTGLICTAINIILSATLMWPFGHCGIAAATVIASALNTILLAKALNRRIGHPGWPLIAFSLLKIFIAAAAMAFTMPIVYRLITEAITLPATAANATALTGAFAAGAATYLSASLLLKCREPIELLEAFRKRREPSTHS